MLRWLLPLLILANLAAAVWWYQSGRASPPPPAQVPGVPLLQSVGADGTALPAAAGSLPLAQAGPVSGACTRIGPFLTAAGMRSAYAALASHVARIQYRLDEVPVERGWWVYLPAGDRAQALQLAQRLTAQGIHDYYVITAGPQQNTLSLGLFQDPANAQRREAQLRALGFAVRLRARVDRAPQYHIEFQSAAATPDWRRLLPDAALLRAQPVACD